MTVTLDDSGRPKRPPILKPYKADPTTFRRRFARTSLIVFMSLFCLIYGFIFALFAPYLIVMFAVVPLILAALMIWALPETGTAPTAFMVACLWAFYVTLIVWPNYLAIALPGMPWITLIRIAGFPMALAMLWAVSSSEPYRKQLAEVLHQTPWVWILFAGFIVMQVLSMPFSNQPFDSVNKFFVAQVSWTAIFFVSAYAFMKPKRAEHWAIAMCLMGVFVCAIAVVEYKKQAVLWAGHIPSFLKIEDETVNRILHGQHRAEATGTKYRVQSTFSTSLGLAEYLAMTMPFLIHFAVGRYNILARLLAGVTIPFFAVIVYLTDSKNGAGGVLLSFLLYPFFWAALRWRRQAKSILGPAIVIAYPVIFLGVMAASFAFNRLRVIFWGGADHEASKQARIEQWTMAFPKMLTHPLGYGIGRGAEAVGFYNSDGTLTLDSYYLMILMDYGLLGFLCYYGMLIAGIAYAARWGYKAPEGDRDYTLLIPLTLSMFNFLVSKSVFNVQDNHPLTFMMLGMTVALVWRVKKELGVAKPLPTNVILPDPRPLARRRLTKLGRLFG